MPAADNNPGRPRRTLLAGILCMALPLLVQAGEPALPEGLDSSSQAPLPALPEGLSSEAETPALPRGLDGGGTDLPAGPSGDERAPTLPAGREATREAGPAAGGPIPAAADTDGTSGTELSGFWEARVGTRTGNDPHERDTSLAETRVKLMLEQASSWATLRLGADVIYDQVADGHGLDLEHGRGILDLRQANLVFSPLAWLDVRAGRQILTWGTGDLLFINDLFPKDWKAFFIGRDEEYLKAPSDAIRFALFSDWANLDLVYSPRFDADRFIDGRRISFFNPRLGRRSGRDAVVRVRRPDEAFRDDEWALRLYRQLRGYELAVYAYSGYWKSPGGFDPATGLATFPRLSVYGGSLRAPLAGGIGNVELGYYDSHDSNGGRNPFVNNDELRLLLGFERELLPDLTLGLQYYLEHMRDHDAYLASLPPGQPARDRNRQLLTARLTWLSHRQNLRWSLFSYYSPSDQDAYLRPKLHYKIDDHWSSEIGANLFLGARRHTFFGQFADDGNVYIGLRYSY